MTRYVYLSPDGRQFSVYAPSQAAAYARVRDVARVPNLMTWLMNHEERPLADEPVTLVDWSGK